MARARGIRLEARIVGSSLRRHADDEFEAWAPNEVARTSGGARARSPNGWKVITNWPAGLGVGYLERIGRGRECAGQL